MLDVSVDKKEFVKKVGYLNEVFSKSGLSPILECAMFNLSSNVKETKFTAWATDLHCALRVSLDSIPTSLGNHKFLVSLVGKTRTKGLVAKARAIKTKRLRILEDLNEHDETLLILKDQGATKNKMAFTLRHEDAEIFPCEEFDDDFEDDRYFTVTLLQKDMYRMISRMFCTTVEKTRYELNNIQVKFNTDQFPATMEFVGTDGKRLAISRCDAYVTNGDAYADVLNTPLGVDFGRLRYLLPILKNATEKEYVRLSIHKEDGNFQIVDTGGNWHFFIKGTHATFPPYHKVIPGKGNGVFSFPVSTFKNAISALRLVTNPKNEVIEFKFSEDRVGCEISSDGCDDAIGSLSLTIGDGNYTGSSVSFQLNPEYLSDYLKVVDAEKSSPVYCSVIDKTKALLFSTNGTLNPKTDSFVYIVLPIRPSENRVV